MFDLSQARTNMVDSQLRPNGVTNQNILDAMQSVLREDFVGSAQKSVAYMDGDLALAEATSQKRFLIEPMAFARMLQAAEVSADDRVLDIGAATGYGAAILAKLVKQVVAVESDSGLANAARQNLAGLPHVTFNESDMTKGAQNAGLFDLIVIEGRIEKVPNVLFSQVKDGGRIVAAVGPQDMAQCRIYKISGKTHTHRSVFDISVAALPGFGMTKPSFAF